MTNESYRSYLWDKSDPPDAFVVKLERLLQARREKVRQAGRRRGRYVLRRVVGSGVMAAVAAAALVLWVNCFGSAGPREGRGETAPPLAIEARPSGDTAPNEILADTAPENEAAQEQPEALAEPEEELAEPATMR